MATTSDGVKLTESENVQPKMLSANQWPIIYHPGYNISFLGLEKLHPFDAGKWGRIHQMLTSAGMITDATTQRPEECSESELRLVHTQRYLNSLRWSAQVAMISEVPFVACLPNFIVQRRVLRPFRLQTAGTILAARLALERGWAINLGGGFHHCSADHGGGFCERTKWVNSCSAYADLTLAVRVLQREGRARRFTIVDLDAHQGNGHEHDFVGDADVFIMDAYNRHIYPHDTSAKRAIGCAVELDSHTGDGEYLSLVGAALTRTLERAPRPDLILYNAGTDILAGDPLGALSISAQDNFQGIIKRDELVFSEATNRSIPVAMVTSGGYQRSTARIIADSILNLREKNLIR